MDGKQRQATASSGVMTEEVWNQMSPQQQQQYMAQWRYYQQLQNAREMAARQKAGQASEQKAQEQYQQWLKQQASQAGSSPSAQPQTQSMDAYQQWLQQQIAARQAQGQQQTQQYQQAIRSAQIQSDPEAYRQHLEQIEQQAGEDQPVFSQPWLSSEQQATKQMEIQDENDYQPQQLAQATATQTQPGSQDQQSVEDKQSALQTENLTVAQPIESPQSVPDALNSSYSTSNYGYGVNLNPQNPLNVKQTIGSGGGSYEVDTAQTKKSHKKLVVSISTIAFVVVVIAIILVFNAISQIGAKTLSCHINSQNNNVANLVSYELTFSVKLTGENFSDINTEASLLFSNNVDAQNYVNSGGDGRVSNTMMANDSNYIKSFSGAVVQGDRVNYSTTFKNSYIGLLGGVGSDMGAYHGTAEQLLNDVKTNLENIGYTCNI